MKYTVTLLYLLALIVIFASANDDILLYKVSNKDHKISAKTIADGFTVAGYTVAKNQDMNGPYQKQFSKTTFDSYNLICHSTIPRRQWHLSPNMHEVVSLPLFQ